MILNHKLLLKCRSMTGVQRQDKISKSTIPMNYSVFLDGGGRVVMGKESRKGARVGINIDSNIIMTFSYSNH